MLQTPPQRFGPRVVAATSAHKAAELRDPAHGRAQRGWRVRRRGTVMDGTRECLPFRDLQQHATLSKSDARPQFPSDRRTRQRARWRRRPSGPPRWSTAATPAASPRPGARFPGRARPTATPRASPPLFCDAAADTASGDKTAAPAWRPGRVVRHDVARATGAAP
jgi:hypothetical protein